MLYCHCFIFGALIVHLKPQNTNCHIYYIRSGTEEMQIHNNRLRSAPKISLVL